MSLQPQAVSLVPEDTARVARAACPKGNVFLRMHDELGRLHADRDFAARFPTRGQPALAPAQLALVTLLQCAEGLSDRQAAAAVRGRSDWKYARCLELDDAGCDHAVLSEFRGRLLTHGQEALRFDLPLARWREVGLVRARAAAPGDPPAGRDRGAGGDPDPQPAGVGRRNAAPRAAGARHRRTRLVAPAVPGRVGRP